MQSNSNHQSRPPIVVILGHVDHGKTTLLDFIRKTSVQKHEAGGITQNIGASQVFSADGNKITFIDTPGHAAFSNMRLRGANIADIAVLIVAANDGVKPQTKEALEYILKSNIPYIVAVTKIDLHQSSIEKAKGELQKEGVLFEGLGGNVPILGVSGKDGTGVKELLETISLLAEMNEISADPNANLDASVIEVQKGKAGPLCSLVVKNGTLSVADNLVSETVEAKARGLFDHTGKQVKSVGPGDPVRVLGFSELPQVGSRVWRKDEGNLELQKPAVTKITQGEDLEGNLAVLIKSGSTGSLEAILKNLPKGVFVLSSGIGEVTETDVFLAKPAGAFIYAFEVKVPGNVSKLADMEGVKIESFSIIYKLFERIGEILQMGVVEIAGTAEIIGEFPFDGKRIAGSKIKKGIIKKGDEIIVKRGETEVGKVKINSIRKGKQIVDLVREGEECGILFYPQLDFKLSDMLISLR